MPGWQGKHGPYLIAEIGGNHEGDFAYAKELAGLACNSQVDAVKFQIYTGDALVNHAVDPERNRHFKKFALSREQYMELASLCIDRGVAFTASVWDIEAIDWIDPYMAFYKIGSGDLTAYPILRKTASMAKPIVLSTGLSALEEVEAAVSYIQNIDERYCQRDWLALLQCTSMYPIPLGDANLAVMQLLRERLHLAVGYSDHTEGMVAVEVAVAMGAELVEFHFTDDREGKTFRDHLVSFTPADIDQLVDRIRLISQCQGQAVKVPMSSEITAGHVRSFRRAIYPSRRLSAGDVVQNEDLVVLRPAVGLGAEHFDMVVGKILARNVELLEPLGWSDFK